MYFKGNNFYPFAIDWQERSAGRIVAPGLGIYFLSPKEKNWALDDITRELEVLRQYGMGHTYFRSKFFTDNTKGIYDYVADNYCTYPALIPAMTWYGFKSPEPPSNIGYSTVSAKSIRLEWKAGKDQSDGSYLTYNIYASTSYPVNCQDAKNIIATYRRGTHITVPNGWFYAVTAVDRYGNESKPRQMFSDNNTKTDEPIEPANPSTCPMFICSKTLRLNQLNHIFSINPKTSLIGIESLKGNIIRTYIPTKDIDLTDIPNGMYIVRSIQKKGITHRLGFLKVKK